MSIHKVIKTVIEEDKAVPSRAKTLNEKRLSRSEVMSLLSALEEPMYTLLDDYLDSPEVKKKLSDKERETILSTVESGIVDIIKKTEKKLAGLK